ncbi:hypothetical protein ACX80J_06370 [Arthrobacter sp. MDB2-24]
MRIEEFGAELWMNAHETHCAHNLAETCVRSLSVDEVLAFSGRREDVLAELTGLRLPYGAIEGTARLRSLIAGLYEHQGADNVVVTARIGYTNTLRSELALLGRHLDGLGNSTGQD